MEMNFFTSEDMALVEQLEKKRRRRREITVSVLILLGCALLVYAAIIRRLPIKTELSLTRSAVIVTDDGIEETTVYINGTLNEYLVQGTRSFHGSIVIEAIDDRYASKDNIGVMVPFQFTETDSYGETGYISYRTDDGKYTAIGSIRMAGEFDSFVIWNKNENRDLPRFVVVSPTDHALTIFDTLMQSDRSADWARNRLFTLEYQQLFGELADS